MTSTSATSISDKAEVEKDGVYGAERWNENRKTTEKIHRSSEGHEDN